MREDTQKVEPVYESLKGAGFAPWIDVRDIHPGEVWVRAIDKAIHDADFFIAFISRNTFNKKGFIHKEIELALEIYKRQPRVGIYFIPVRLEPVEPPVPFIEFQWIDVFSPDDYQKLIFAIKSVWEKQKS